MKLLNLLKEAAKDEVTAVSSSWIDINASSDSRNETYHDGQAGAIYKQTPPAVNAMRPPSHRNSYDIFWTAPRFDDQGKLVSAYITAIHNGVLILIILN